MRKRILACMFACLTFFCSCAPTPQEESKEPVNTTPITVDGNFDGGLHKVDYTSTSDYLVKNKNSEYKLLVPQNPSAEISTTAEDFIALFQEATGVKLIVEKDNGTMQHNASAKYISLGETSLAKSAGVSTQDDELEYFGYSIKTVGKSIFINGNSDISITFGVYGFLELQFNFDCFSNTCYHIDSVKESPLYNYDVKEAPDLKMREEFYPINDGYARRRMKYVSRNEMIAGEGTVHSSMVYVSPDKYNNPDDKDNYHPEWFGAGLTQLCYTAGGNKESRDLMLNTVLKVAQDYFIAEPNDNIFTFGQMDVATWCSCPACAEAYTKYNSNAAVLVHFINDLTTLVDDWMASEEGKPYARDYQIIFLAYQKTLPPPAYYDEATKTYKPVDDSVVCKDHASVMFAPMEMDYQHSINEECNASFKSVFEGWKVLSSRFNFYSYPINYNHTLVFYDGLEVMQELYQYLAECDTYYFYECGPMVTTLTAFKALIAYVSAELSWNVNLDVNALIEKFCRYHFQDGGDVMLQVFKEVRGLTRANIDMTCRRNSVYMMLEDVKLWPKTLLQRWLNLTNDALAKVSYLQKIDPEKYDVVSTSIRRERISFEYLLVELYGTELDSTYVEELKLQTQADANVSGITHNGGIAAATIWQKWGID